MKKVVLYLLILGLLFTFGCSKNDSKSSSNNNQISQSNPVEEKKIYGTMDINYSWNVEPIAKNLVENSASVARIKVLSTDEALFVESLKYDSPLTPINVEILEILSGDEITSPTTIYEFGGTVSIEELIKNTPEEQIQKMGIDKLTEEEKSTNYIEFASDTEYTLEDGDEYIVILYKQPNNIYTLAANGYGVFKQSNTSNAKSITYTNVLTGEEFDFQ